MSLVTKNQNQAFKKAPEPASTQGGVYKKVPGDFDPRRFGLKFNPPTIILEYLSKGKLYHHKLRLRKLTAHSDINEELTTLRYKHGVYLTHVGDKQLLALISKVQSHLKAEAFSRNNQPAPTKTAAQILKENTNTYGNDEYEDDFEELLENELGSNFGSKQTAANNAPKTSWSTTAAKKGAVEADDFMDIDDDEDENYGGNTQKQSPGVKAAYGEEDDEDIDYQTTNLNKLSPEEVAIHKAKMDVGYKANLKKPGDPGYVYDVEEDFSPNKKCEWDDDDF